MNRGRDLEKERRVKAVMGVVYSVLAGVFIGLQSVFNARVGEKIGLWGANVLIHGVGFVLALLIFLCFKQGDINKIGEINKIYLLGSTFGVLIVFSAMKGLLLLGPVASISILMVSQLTVAVVLEVFGMFEVTKIDLNPMKIIGIGMMAAGIFLFQSR